LAREGGVYMEPGPSLALGLITGLTVPQMEGAPSLAALQRLTYRIESFGVEIERPSTTACLITGLIAVPPESQEPVKSYSSGFHQVHRESTRLWRRMPAAAVACISTRYGEWNVYVASTETKFPRYGEGCNLN
jgi:hypothetical protein